MQHTEFTATEIAEFIGMWAREFDEVISEGKAILEMQLVMELYETLVQPLPGESGYKAEQAGSDPKSDNPNLLQ
jgi:hypothetical protein